MKTLEEAISEAKSYAELNGIDDIEAFVTKCLIDGLNICKYGTSPKDNFRREHGIIDNTSKPEVQNVEDKPVPEKRKKTVRTIKEKK